MPNAALWGTLQQHLHLQNIYRTGYTSIEMIFGWGKKEPVPAETVPERRDVDLSDVPQVLSDLEERRASALVQETNAIRNVIVPGFERLFDIVRALERDQLKTEEMDRHLKALAVRGKRQTVSVIKKETDRRVASVESADDVRIFAEQVGKSIKRMGDTLGRHTRVVPIIAKKHTNKLKDTLSSLNTDREELFKLVRRYDEFREELAEMNALMDKITEYEKTNSERQARVEALRQEVDTITSRINSIEESVADITASSEYAEYSRKVERLASMQQAEKNIRQEIESQFTKISRPLSKYVYVSSLDRDHMNTLDMMVTRPADALRSASKEEIIIVLMAVRKGVLSGSVSVKDQMKATAQIDETVEMLDTFINKFAEHDAQCRKLEEDLRLFDTSELGSRQNDLKRARSELDECTKKIDAAESETEEWTAHKANMTRELERLLSASSSTRYKIL